MDASREHVHIPRWRTSRKLLLKVGNLVHYIVPSFPVIQVTLREKDGTLHVFDAFARDCDLLNHPMPAIVKLLFPHSTTSPLQFPPNP